MSTYRGSDGQVSVDGTVVAEVQSWSANMNRPFLDDTAMGDDAREGKLDVPEWSGEITARFDYGDPAQASIVDALIGNAADPGLTVELAVDGATAAKTISGSILPTQGGVTSERGSLVEITFSFEGNGAATIAWA